MARQTNVSGISRRSLIAGAAAAAFPIAAPAVHARTRELRLLNDQTAVESLRALKVAAAQYERDFGVRVTIDTVPSENLYPRLIAAIRGKKPYDLSMIIFVAHMLSLAKEGYLTPVNSLVKKYKWGKRILFPVNGIHYYYPWAYTMCWLYYRKDLYDQLNLEPAKTWSQFLENARKTAADSPTKRFGHTTPIGSNVATNWMTFGFLWAEGVKLFDDDWNLALASDAAQRKTAAYLDFMAELSNTMPPGATQFGFASALQQFGADQAAHAPYAGRMIEYLEQRAPQLADKYGIMPYPDSKGLGRAINHGYKGFLVGKTDMAEESLKFLSWWSDAQYINFLHSAPLNFQPPRLDIYDDPRWAAHPLIEKHAAAVKTMRDFLNEPTLTLRSIDTEGPYADIRPAKIFESYVFPEMVQNRLLSDMPSAECVEKGVAKIRQLVA